MLPRLLVAGFAIAVVIAGCGSGGPSASPSASASTASTAPTVTTAPAVAPSTAAAPTVAPSAATPASMVAACGAVGLRKLPSSKGALVVRIAVGTSVAVAETVPGDAYTAGACGTSGDTWLKIDGIGGKDVAALYGAPFLYAAAGFFR